MNYHSQNQLHRRQRQEQFDLMQIIDNGGKVEIPIPQQFNDLAHVMSERQRPTGENIHPNEVSAGHGQEVYDTNWKWQPPHQVEAMPLQDVTDDLKKQLKKSSRSLMRFEKQTSHKAMPVPHQQKIKKKSQNLSLVKRQSTKPIKPQSYARTTNNKKAQQVIRQAYRHVPTAENNSGINLHMDLMNRGKISIRPRGSSSIGSRSNLNRIAAIHQVI